MLVFCRKYKDTLAWAEIIGVSWLTHKSSRKSRKRLDGSREIHVRMPEKAPLKLNGDTLKHFRSRSSISGKNIVSLCYGILISGLYLILLFLDLFPEATQELLNGDSVSWGSFNSRIYRFMGLSWNHLMHFQMWPTFITMGMKYRRYSSTGVYTEVHEMYYTAHIFVRREYSRIASERNPQPKRDWLFFNYYVQETEDCAVFWNVDKEPRPGLGVVLLPVHNKHF